MLALLPWADHRCQRVLGRLVVELPKLLLHLGHSLCPLVKFLQETNQKITKIINTCLSRKPLSPLQAVPTFQFSVALKRDTGSRIKKQLQRTASGSRQMIIKCAIFMDIPVPSCGLQFMLLSFVLALSFLIHYFRMKLRNMLIMKSTLVDNVVHVEDMVVVVHDVVKEEDVVVV
jgi:hypothetical protein